MRRRCHSDPACGVRGARSWRRWLVHSHAQSSALRDCHYSWFDRDRGFDLLSAVALLFSDWTDWNAARLRRQHRLPIRTSSLTLSVISFLISSRFVADFANSYSHRRQHAGRARPDSVRRRYEHRLPLLEPQHRAASQHQLHNRANW